MDCYQKRGKGREENASHASSHDRSPILDLLARVESRPMICTLWVHGVEPGYLITPQLSSQCMEAFTPTLIKKETDV
jgi:hypothetical protein